MHSINRRDVIAKAGAVAGASLVALPAVAGSEDQEISISTRERLEMALDEFRAALREHYGCEVHEWVAFEAEPMRDPKKMMRPHFNFIPLTGWGQS